MKIKLYETDNQYWRYIINEYFWTQNQYDYIFKYLNFDKLGKYILMITKQGNGFIKHI